MSKVKLWRHVFQCSDCGQVYDFVAETQDTGAARDEWLRQIGCEVIGDAIRCHKCVNPPT